VKEVFTVERLDSLAMSAVALLKKKGYENIKLSVEDGTGRLQ